MSVDWKIPYCYDVDFPQIDLQNQHNSNQNMSKAVRVVAPREQIQLGTMRLWVRSLVLLSGLRIQGCRELWCRLHMRLRSGVSVAVV